MNYLACTSRILCFFLILLGIFGCGDEDTSVVNEDPSEKIVGSWELITIDGKTPKADSQQDRGDDEGEVVEAGGKFVFGADSSFFREYSLVIKQRVKDNSVVIPGLLLDFTIRYYLSLTLNGTYIISDQVIEFIQGDRVNVDFDFSIDDTESFPALEELEQEVKESLQEFARELEQKFVSELELELDTHTFDFEGDRLTLMNGSKSVYRKK